MAFPKDVFTEWFAKNEEKIFKDFSRFLSFRSISTDASCKPDCLQAADFLTRYLQEIGMKAQLLPSSGLPVVFATKQEDQDRSVLLYHHYDVQPVDPIELWNSDPFCAKKENGKVFARGSSDNKGQCFITLTALKALHQLGYDLPLHIKLFIEGEEESGGPGTKEVIDKYKDLLRADSLCVIDFDLAEKNIPAISMGYRGIIALEVECKNSATDLHSGSHGGLALNPLRILTDLFSRFWKENGEIAIPHFYDGIKNLSQEEKSKIDFSFDEEKYRKEFGVGALSREEGILPQEAVWLRPTIEINGMWGGYTGVGFKTVLPARAHAKISCRLVPGQDPDKIGNLVANFLEKNAPKGAVITTKIHHGALAYRSDFSSPLIHVVQNSMEQVFASPCRYTLAGGSVPIVQDLAQAAQGEVALFGFALATDNIHAPNEHFQWECFKKGFLVMGQILWDLAREKK